MRNKTGKKYILGIDIGGTKILAGLCDLRCRVLARKKIKLDAHKGEKAFLKMLMTAIDGVLEEADVSRKNVRAAGFGCPGMIENPKGIVRLSPNIGFLKNYPLRTKLKRLLRMPVYVENDVNAGLYGEHQFGAARGFCHVLGVFMGTGVGGALILDNKIYRGATGAAGEIGHTWMQIPSFLPDDKKTLEVMTGRHAISIEAGNLILKQKARALYNLVGFDIKKIKSRTLMKAIRGGDAEVKKLIQNKARLTGLAIANAVNLLNPQIVVLGGGVVEAMAGFIIPEAMQTMKKYALGPVVKAVRIVPARLKDDAVVMGAAKLAIDAAEGKIL